MLVCKHLLTVNNSTGFCLIAHNVELNYDSIFQQILISSVGYVFMQIYELVSWCSIIENIRPRSSLESDF